MLNKIEGFQIDKKENETLLLSLLIIFVIIILLLLIYSLVYIPIVYNNRYNKNSKTSILISVLLVIGFFLFPIFNMTTFAFLVNKYSLKK